MPVIHLIRHGQASFAAAEYDQLSALGQQQARLLGEGLLRRAVRADLVICGNMRRHRQTAEACLGAMGAEAAWQTDIGWDEYDHNDVLAAYDPRFAVQASLAALMQTEADPRAAFQHHFSRAVARWVSGEHDADYRETWTVFRARVSAALERLAASLQRSQTALVFTSGGAISVVVAQLLELPDDAVLRLNWTIANASTSKLLVGRGRVLLSTLNEHAHLEGHGASQITYR